MTELDQLRHWKAEALIVLAERAAEITELRKSRAHLLVALAEAMAAVAPEATA